MEIGVEPMQSVIIPKVVGGLMLLTAVLGIVILGFDGVLRSGAPAHYYALIFFVAVDILIGILVTTKPSNSTYTAVVWWSSLRIILQLADISQASMYQFASYGQFADYLFNPASAVSAGLGNPPAIPGLPIDLILILELAAIVLSLKGRSVARTKPGA